MARNILIENRLDELAQRVRLWEHRCTMAVQEGKLDLAQSRAILARIARQEMHELMEHCN